jgi:hypothetical protein
MFVKEVQGYDKTFGEYEKAGRRKSRPNTYTFLAIFFHPFPNVYICLIHISSRSSKPAYKSSRFPLHIC